jgi:VanZ family protein
MRNFINFLSTYWFPVTVMLLVIISALSLTPLEQLPLAPGSDKLHHLIAYAALSIPLALKKPRHWWFIVSFFLVYSGLIELIQPYVNRYGEWLDMAANSLGMFCGLLIAELLNYFFPARLEQSD